MSKQRVIVEAVLAGKSQRTVAKQYGVSQPRVSQLVAIWRMGGWDALQPGTRRPKTNPHSLPETTVSRILELRTELTAAGHDAGAHTIRTRLARESAKPPAASTIWNVLKRAGLITPQPKKRPKHSYLRFEADLPNECWQSDFTHWHLADGSDTNILIFIDDHSRFIVRATAHLVVTGTVVVTQFRTAIAEHGTPASTLTDNGLVFTARHVHGANGFEIELANLGIEQKNGRPNHPQTQVKVERLNQTLKKWLTAQTRAHDLPTLQQQLDEFTNYYNTARPHRSLAGHTPAETYQARAKATPTGRDNHFRIRDDKVYATGSVTLRRGGKLHHIGLGTEHAGKTIRMLIHDLNITIIDRNTGEILRELTLDETRNNQPRGIKPGPKKGSPRRGGIQQGHKRNKHPKI